ncbi:hypothetical protein [Ruegeria atlantica]|uniref:hypothetical protein n=1 Tax=Ruegeria atlantica TaxID=81569 RepID=UPI0024954537|nr:hypothetical protein [Ruegeria atlantica]
MWELMFTRFLLSTAELARPGRILSRVARLVDDGIIRATEQKSFMACQRPRLKKPTRLLKLAA